MTTFKKGDRVRVNKNLGRGGSWTGACKTVTARVERRPL
jgi:hypothetical protein